MLALTLREVERGKPDHFPFVIFISHLSFKNRDTCYPVRSAAICHQKNDTTNLSYNDN